MRSLMLATICSCAIAATVSAQDPPSPPQAQTEWPNHFYVPDLGDLMGATQLRHFKLWFAGNVKNWDLANYEVVEIKKSFDAAAKFYPVFQNIPLGKLITEVSEPALAEIGKAIAAQDSASFTRSFEALTEACNSCHRAANVGFIRIRLPTSSPFSNQIFSPAQR